MLSNKKYKNYLYGKYNDKYYPIMLYNGRETRGTVECPHPEQLV